MPSCKNCFSKFKLEPLTGPLEGDIYQCSAYRYCEECRPDWEALEEIKDFSPKISNDANKQHPWKIYQDTEATIKIRSYYLEVENSMVKSFGSPAYMRGRDRVQERLNDGYGWHDPDEKDDI